MEAAANAKGSLSVAQQFGVPKPEQNPCCYLCQSVHRKLCRLSTAENLKSLIRKYLQIKVLYQRNKFVCEDCAEKLKSLRSFVLQGRKNNEYLKALPNELLPQEEKYCRLCLATTGCLQAIFIENTQEHNNVLCQLINKCIAIELDYHRDFISHICAFCRTQLDVFITFKHITLQMQNKSTDAINLETEEINEVMEVIEENNVSTAFKHNKSTDAINLETEEINEVMEVIEENDVPTAFKHNKCTDAINLETEELNDVMEVIEENDLPTAFRHKKCTDAINLETEEINEVMEVIEENNVPTAFKYALKDINDQSDEPVKKKTRKRRTKAEMTLVRAQALCEEPTKPKKTRKRRTKAEMALFRAQVLCECENPTKPKTENNQMKISPTPKFALSLKDRKRTTRILWVADGDRNFEVIRGPKSRILIRMDGFGFYLYRNNTDGSSLWYCEYRLLSNCRVKVIISANGKTATVCEPQRHSHDKVPAPLLKCPLGKGTVLNSDGTTNSFWLVDRRSTFRYVQRHLFYLRHRYVLRTCNKGKDVSLWDCSRSSCKVTLKVIGIFEKITILKGTHVHPEVESKEWRDSLRDCRIRMNSKDVITPFRDGKCEIENGGAVPNIYIKLAYTDPSRNFDVVEVGENIYKIRYEGYDYKLYFKRQDGKTLWKCMWDDIRNCKAAIVVANNGTTTAYYGQAHHSHPLEPAQIIQCDPKQYSVRNTANDDVECFTVLARACKYFFSRTILYRSHFYNLYQIENDESRWSCISTDAFGQQCPASMIVTGKMESFIQKGVHCHLPMKKHDIERVIKPGNVLELSALEQNDHSSTNADMVEPGTSDDVIDILKRQLFRHPMGLGQIWDKTDSRNNPFYFVKKQATNTETPYKFFYQQYGYAFASIDEYGISQWFCCQLRENSALVGACTARVTIEGVFQRVSAEGSHNHEVTS